jgi:DNA-binding MarR family transcriptional regulator
MAEAHGDLAREAWKALLEVALSHDRKAEICAALGLSWVRVLALRRLAAGALTMRGLADALNADPPYVTLIVDDLEARRFVRRKPHPSDRRAKLVELTAAGGRAAARAEALLSQPPEEFAEAARADLAAVLRALSSLRPA